MAHAAQHTMTILNTYIWLAPMLALMLALFSLLILTISRANNKSHTNDLTRRFNRAFGAEIDAVEIESSSNLLESIGNRIIRNQSSLDNEVKILLAQAGWKKKSDLAFFYATQALLPLAGLVICAYILFFDGIDQKDWGILIVVGILCFLLPKRILSYRANNRREQIARQTPTMVHLLQVLLATGLSIEQALRSLSVETKSLLPDLADELTHLLRRVEAGEDLSFAMTDTARLLDIPSLTDLALILEQTWRIGGSITKSLTALSELIESRTQTDLKERVSKLSAKMTMVMMTFLFPALLVFLAAPGFLAIIQGFKNVAG